MARYYPNGTNRPKKRSDGDLWDNSATLEDNGITDWLYKDEWTKEDQDRFDRLYGLPGYHQYFDYVLDARIRQRLFDLYGIDYANVHDPRNVVGTASTGALVRYGVNFISDNVRFLYRKSR